MGVAIRRPGDYSSLVGTVRLSESGCWKWSLWRCLRAGLAWLCLGPTTRFAVFGPSSIWTEGRRAWPAGGVLVGGHRWEMESGRECWKELTTDDEVASSAWRGVT